MILRPATAVIFDLDGTLVQTRKASWEVFRQISDEFGLGLSGPQEYYALFNGNVFASLDQLCQGRADSAQVKKAFLDRLRAEYNPALVPGMVDVVRLKDIDMSEDAYVMQVFPTSALATTPGDRCSGRRTRPRAPRRT